MDPKGIEAVESLKDAKPTTIGEVRHEAVESLKDTKPTTIEEVRHLIGLLGYYRRYIPNFSRIAKPLYDLLNTANSTSPTGSKNGHLASSTKIHWTQKHQESLEKLIGFLRHIKGWSWGNPVPKARRKDESDFLSIKDTNSTRKELSCTLG
jgi:hypothetical protein